MSKALKPRRKIGAVQRRPWTAQAQQYFEREGLLFKLTVDQTPKFYTVRTNKRTLTYRASYMANGFEATCTIRVDKRFPPL